MTHAIIVTTPDGGVMVYGCESEEEAIDVMCKIANVPADYPRPGHGENGLFCLRSDTGFEITICPIEVPTMWRTT